MTAGYLEARPLILLVKRFSSAYYRVLVVRTGRWVC